MSGAKHIRKTADTPLPGTKEEVFVTAERLFATNGFQNVSVRDITTEANVNLASINYHFGSKDALLFEIFKVRSSELNRDRTGMLNAAIEAHGGKPPVREILRALFWPPLAWLSATDHRRTSISFILRARTEGTPAMREALQKNITHLKAFATALAAARPELAEDIVAWKLHFCLGLVHNNRFIEFERLRQLSKTTKGTAPEVLLDHMLDFAEAGFRA